MTNPKELVPIRRRGKIVGYTVKGQVIEVTLTYDICKVDPIQRVFDMYNGLFDGKTIFVTLPTKQKVEFSRKEYVAFLRNTFNGVDATEDHATVKRLLAPDCPKGEWGGVGVWVYGRLLAYLESKACRQTSTSRKVVS